MSAKIHLFPHSYLPEPAIRTLASLLGPVRVYLPWFMNPPGFFKDYELETINPPEDYKPGEDFKAILSGYRAWAQENHDRSLMETLKYSGRSSQNDSSTWDIRRLLKGAAESVHGTKEGCLPLKHHLLLYLASEIEMRHFEIMDMIGKIKEKGPVLAGALHNPGEAGGVFADMDDIAETGIRDSITSQPLLDAWFGLFGGYIKENDILATCSLRVMDYISSQWDEGVADDKRRDSHSISFSLPEISSERYKEAGISKIRELILGFNKDPENYTSEIKGFVKVLENAFSSKTSQELIKIKIRHFPSMNVGLLFERNDLLSRISGRNVILISLF